jgi:phosphate transport system substrate-binding protein
VTAGLLILATTLLLSGCGTGNIPAGRPTLPAVLEPGGDRCKTGSLSAEGSSAQQRAMNRWRDVYQQDCPGAIIGYEPNDSGAGIAAFIAGKVDFAGSDTPLSADEQRAADQRCRAGPAIHLPMAVGQIAVAYRVPGLYNLKLGPVSLARIFSGSVTKWNDPAIQADNPAAALPSTPIHTVHRSDSSGTTDNFTAFLAATAPDAWVFGRSKDWKAPGGTGVAGSSAVAHAVDNGQGTIGYVELSWAESVSLSVAGINNGAGDFLQPTSDRAANMIQSSKIQSTGNNIRVDINYAAQNPAAYPIVLVTYEIVCQKGLDPGKAALARGFLAYTANDLGQRELPQLGYAPLPLNLRLQVESAAASIG